MDLKISLQCPKCKNWVLVDVEVSKNTVAQTRCDFNRGGYVESDLVFPVSFVCGAYDIPCDTDTFCYSTIRTIVTLTPQMGPMFVTDREGKTEVME